MTTKNIPYKYYKASMLSVWLLSLLCLIGTWVAFCVDSTAALIFGVIVDIVLTLALCILVALLFLNGRQDYRTRAWIFAGLTLVHIIFFILVLALRMQIYENSGIYALPALHTVILIVVCVTGMYFWIRNRFVFKSFAEQDAVAAFGGSIDKQPEASQPASQATAPVEPQEAPKPARDEKTGIVSL